MTQVFISTKSEYLEFAVQLRDRLREWGYGTWLAEDDISDGAYFRAEIQQGLENSQIVLGVLTADVSIERELIAQWLYAHEPHNPAHLLIVRYENVPVPYYVADATVVDFTTEEAEGFAQLQAALQNPATTHPPSSQMASGQQIGGTGNVQQNVNKMSGGTIIGKQINIKVYGEFSPPQPEAAAPPTKTQQSNREVMLQKVHDYWIVGVLDKAEQHNPLIDLEFAKPDAVLRHPDYPDYTLPPEADIGTLFADTQRQLLILGAPGAGKTTLMLQLCRDLLTEATEDNKQPMPVVFNLSSWAAKQEPLADWLKDRLWQEYQVSKKVATRWVDDGAILPLLDGLDEVAYAHRDECAKTINTFQRNYPFLDLVVCSRIEEYLALTDRLRLASIQLQALTQEQIDAYMQGDDLTAVRDLIASDPIVREMAKTPFLLNTLAYSYTGLSEAALAADGDTEDTRRDHLFNRYVDKRIKATNSVTTQRDTRHYLSFLATQLVKHDLIVFYIENLQLTWLTDKRLYRRLVGLMIGLMIGLATGLAFSLGGRLVLSQSEIDG